MSAAQELEELRTAYRTLLEAVVQLQERVTQQETVTARHESSLVRYETVPVGAILPWHPRSGDLVPGPSGSLQARVPDGWALCDGTNGTPNLVDRFPMG